MEGWQKIFSYVITPVLFGGLFTMSFVTMIIALRGEKRAIAKNQIDIVKNAKSIARNYRLLKAASKGHENLEKVLEVQEENNNNVLENM